MSLWSTMVVSIQAHGFGGGRSIVAVSLRRHGRWVKSSAPHFAQTWKPSISSARAWIQGKTTPSCRFGGVTGRRELSACPG